MDSSRTCDYRYFSGGVCGRRTQHAIETRCEFHRYVDVSQNRWNGSMDHLVAYVRNTPEGSCTDLAEIQFVNAEFNDKTLPSGYQLLFDGSRFTNCTFRDLTLANVSFARGCLFRDSTFRRCRFEGSRCDFSRAVFRTGEPPFVGCTFELRSNGGQRESRLRFESCEAEVGGALFLSCVAFAERFEGGKIRLWGGNGEVEQEFLISSDDQLGRSTNGIELRDVKSFRLTRLEFRGRLSILQSHPSLGFAPAIDLQDVDFSGMRLARLTGVDLRNASFAGSSIENLRFENCVWGLDRGRKLLTRDQLLLQYAPEELVRLYVQLKKNDESRGDYIGAGDWHYREMEARRELATMPTSGFWRPFRKHLSLISLYKLGSDFGESYLRPLGWLLLTWFLFAGIYFFSGFSMSGRSINYDLRFQSGIGAGTLGDFARALVCSLAAMTLQVGKTVDLTGAWSSAWYSIQLTLTAVLVPLLLLAVRRKFRR